MKIISFLAALWTAALSHAGGHPLAVHHLLLEVHSIERSLKFYQDFLGFQVLSRSRDFVMLKGANLDFYLWEKTWDWEKPRKKPERPGFRLYPHFEVEDVPKWVERAKKEGFRIVQEPRFYDWGTEAFIADPDGFVFSFVSLNDPRCP